MEVKKDSFWAWVLAARPKTLTGAAVPVMIGVSLAWVDARAFYEPGAFSVVAAVLCFLFAFIMQIDANFINDFVDYARGTDDGRTRLGPERACTQGWVSIGTMKHAIAVTTCLGCLVGLPLIVFGGLEMLLVGMACVAACFLYTTHLSYIGLGDLLVLLFFGVVPVCVTYYVQLHELTVAVVVASVACGLVIDTLLVVNNFRDRDTDRDAGKMTLVVRIGEKASLWLYLALGVVGCILAVAFMSWMANSLEPLTTGTESFLRQWAFVLPLLYLPLHVSTFMQIKRIDHGRELNRCLGMTSRNIFVYGILVSAGLLAMVWF